MTRASCPKTGWLPLLLLLSACSSPAHARPQPTAAVLITTFTATPSPPPTFTPTPTATVSHTPGPTLTPSITPTPVCGERSGAVISDLLESKTLNYPMELRIYLPPCYETRTWESYPALYLLHGLEMTEKTWAELGADETADRLMASGEIRPLLIVMPRERRDSRFGAALVDELVPYIDSHYRTLADRQYRALGGMSRGAGWAANVGFQHPDLFGALGLHSLAIFYRDEAKISRWLDGIPPELRPRVYIDIGDKDGLLVSASWLDQALTQRDFAHDYHLNRGAHKREYWSEYLPEYLRWYTETW